MNLSLLVEVGRDSLNGRDANFELINDLWRDRCRNDPPGSCDQRGIALRERSSGSVSVSSKLVRVS